MGGGGRGGGGNGRSRRAPPNQPPNQPPGRKGVRLGPGRAAGRQGCVLRIEEERLERPSSVSRDLTQQVLHCGASQSHRGPGGEEQDSKEVGIEESNLGRVGD